jgi:hypothetical protein
VLFLCFFFYKKKRKNYSVMLPTHSRFHFLQGLLLSPWALYELRVHFVLQVLELNGGGWLLGNCHAMDLMEASISCWQRKALIEDSVFACSSHILGINCTRCWGFARFQGKKKGMI